MARFHPAQGPQVVETGFAARTEKEVDIAPHALRAGPAVGDQLLDNRIDRGETRAARDAQHVPAPPRVRSHFAGRQPAPEQVTRHCIVISGTAAPNLRTLHLTTP